MICAFDVKAAWTIFCRAFTLRLSKVQPLPKENAELVRTSSPVMCTYLVWRRSISIVSLPLLLFTMIMSFVAFRDVVWGDQYNGFGVIMQLLPLLDMPVMFVFVSWAMFYWTDTHRSTRLLRVGWLIAFALPLLPLFFPLDFSLKTDNGQAYVIAEKTSQSLAYALQLVPVLITFPAGLMRGALFIIHGFLLNDSSFASFNWLLVVGSVTLWSMITLLSLTVILMQVLGDILMFIGTVVLVATPWVHVTTAEVVRTAGTTHIDAVPGNDNPVKILDRTQRYATISNFIGGLCVVLWAFTSEVTGIRPLGDRDGALHVLSYSDGVRLLFASFCRILITTVVFSDMILGATVQIWRIETERKRYEDEHYEEHRTLLFESIQEAMKKQSYTAASSPPTISASQPYAENDNKTLNGRDADQLDSIAGEDMYIDEGVEVAEGAAPSSLSGVPSFNQHHWDESSTELNSV